ncbi:TPA: sensor histidine kinase [Streptococcus suis]
MLDGQQAAMRQVYQLQTKHAEAVLKALQAQVNPHFLYNTLEYIRMSAYVEGADSLAEFVYDFASLMRRNISSEKSATLAEEVQFIQTYIRLFQARYPGKLELDLMIDPETEDWILPKFTLQPLVENYLVHGIDFAEKGNRISIESHYEEGIWRLVIADNGKGIEQEKLDQLNRKIASVIQAPYALDQSASSIGLVLVAQRLSQYFGQETHMKLSTNEQGGVTTWICLRKK